MRLKRLLFLFFILLLISAQAQELNFTRSFHHMSSGDGLLNAEIYNVIQDSKGNMWFSTDAGVVRYDGFYFKVFGKEDGLLNNVVFESFEDPFGKIWFITLSNELCYLEDGKIVTYEFNDLIKEYTKEVTSNTKFLYIDKQGVLYYATSKKGLIRIDTSGEMTVLHNTPQTYQITRIDDQDIPSFLTGDYVKFSPGENKENLPVIYQSEGEQMLLGTFGSGKGCNFVRGNDQLSLAIVSQTLIDLKRGVPIAQNFRDCIVDPYETNTIWSLGVNGAQKCTYRNGKLIYGESYLDGKQATDIYWDSEGGVWLTTLNDGVFYSPNEKVSFADLSAGLSRNSITGITEFKGDMYVGSFGGYQKVGENGWFRKGSGSAISLCNAESHLVVSSNLNVELKKQGDFIKVPYSRDIKYKDGFVYFILSRVIRYHIQTNKIDTLYNSYTDLSESKQNFFRALEILPNNELLVGGRFGIATLKNGHLLNNYKWSNSFDVTSIYHSDQFGLVVATNNNGIILSKEGEHRKIINASNGLASNKVRCLLELENGLLLIGTNNGLNYMFNGDVIPQLISENQGLINTDVLSLYANSKFVFIGTKGGMHRLDRALFEKNGKCAKPKIYLEAVFVDGEAIKNRLKSSIELPYGTGRLRIRFRTTNYKKWVNKRYQYRLSKNESWIDIQSPEIVIYKPLGEFEIEIRSEDDRDRWSTPVSILKCDVYVPIWKRWYSIVFAVLVALFLAFFWLYRIQSNARRKLTMKNEILSLEQRMQNARMNPHFVFNVLNSIHSFIVFGDKSSAEKYLVKFSELMRNTLNETLEGSISIDNELSILHKYLELEQLRSAHSFEYEILHTLDNGSKKIPTMILQPIVENAILHGISGMETGGFISIHLSQLNEHAIEAKVFNNGDISEEQMTQVNDAQLNNALGITTKRLINYNLLNRTEQYGMTITRIHFEKEGVQFKLIIPVI